MRYPCKILELDPAFEEAAWFEIQGYKLYCFIAYWPNEIQSSKRYQIELDLFYDRVQVVLSDAEVGFKKINQHSLAYKITGLLKNAKLSIGNLEFDCHDISYEYPYMEDKIISFIVDRLDISLVQEID